ncbi:hypothetical protein [Empedobacter sp. GD03739]|uniref:hypothetical protein n=1 Tax=Empedobacter TaxID=59734 RepID=UPI002447D4F2|nr:hypothetical protein [Empedobacter sp. GD03739]MDH1603947.1 hypothetical protein [Empedobacter sp. GD03739]
MDKLKELDNKLTALDLDLKAMMDEIQFQEIETFKFEDFSNRELDFKEFNFKGLYMFEIKNNGFFEDINDWKNDFTKRWCDEEFLRRFVPNVRKKRLKELTDSNQEWIPLYIGKSRSVGKRIHEHIYKPIEKTTFAMKLKARHNLSYEVFRISAVKIDVNNYNWIVPVLENELRNRLNPIVGKQ